MANKVNNSLDTFLSQSMTLTRNSLETVSKINDAVTSNDENVTLTLTDPDDSTKTKTYNIPSFGYLKSEIERLSNAINTLSNITAGSGSSIRLSDGTYRKIIASKVASEAPTITSVNNITNFNFKSNWFFEDMLNPALYVTWDMSSQISVDTERVQIRRYILKCETQLKQKAFDSIKGRNNIDFNEFLNFIVNNKIRYTLDDEVKDLPPREKRFSGDFSVIKVTVEKDVNGRNVNRYYLSSLEYSDNRTSRSNTRVLSVGDIVEVVKKDSNGRLAISTRYEVNYASPSESCIGLKCIEGTDGVGIGVDVLRISSTQDSSVSADIPVGFDEREVIFVKPIDPDSNIPAVQWSPGVAFYTNELTYTDSEGNVQTLQSFYQKNVVDFGQVLLSYTTDYYPSIREGLTPNRPVLNYSSEGGGDFKIVQINNQLRESADSDALRKLVANKVSIQSEIDNITKQISAQKEAIQTTNYVSTEEKLKAQSSLNAMIAQHSTLMSNYNSVIGSIKSKYDSTENASPKYRVRGFWDIPDSRYSESSGEQKIIKFKIRYRYLSKTGNTNREDEFSYTSNGNLVVGRFSNWNEIETKQRQRVKTSSGWEWEDIDTADPETVNINQLDIPIQKGEQVEIQVKSVSEAGWPSNPMESDWSDAIIVSFSDFAELEADDISDIIAQNRIDASLSSVASAMTSTNEHMSSSFYTNDKYFAHTAESITSGFLSPEQTPITLYDKLQDLQKQITVLKEQIYNVRGEISVSLVDSNDVNTVYNLTDGSTTYINAGNYEDSVSSLDEDKRNGAIVTKIYYLDIKANVNSGLYLISRLRGNRMSMCPNTLIDRDTYKSLDTTAPVDTSNTSQTNNYNYDYENDSVKDAGYNKYAYYDNIVNESSVSSKYYNERGRYDLVPINLTNSDYIDFQISSPNMYQSAQCKGQFVYSRFRNIADTFDMYANCNDGVTINPTALFKECEKSYAIEPDYYKDRDSVIDEYNNLTASNVSFPSSSTVKNDDYVSQLSGFAQIINRLPKNWGNKKYKGTSGVIQTERKLMYRISSNNSNAKKDMEYSSRLAERVENLTYNDTSNTQYLISPTIQSAYGYGDWGNIVHSGVRGNLDDSKITIESDYTYLTTHKIGYEDKDRYAKGPETCDSFLFMSPISHSSIQVNGDADDSSVYVDSIDNTIRVPIVYQYRMTDYTGKIFGDIEDKSSSVVKNTKYANIIGLDIWTADDYDKPKQFDLIVYSTYTSGINTETSKTSTSTQTLVDAVNRLANNQSSLLGKASGTSNVLNK